jgi:hypothetical protein
MNRYCTGETCKSAGFVAAEAAELSHDNGKIQKINTVSKGLTLGREVSTASSAADDEETREAANLGPPRGRSGRAQRPSLARVAWVPPRGMGGGTVRGLTKSRGHQPLSPDQISLSPAVISSPSLTLSTLSLQPYHRLEKRLSLRPELEPYFKSIFYFFL